MVQAIDRSAIKQQQRRTWDAVSVGWLKCMDLFEAGAGQVTDRLLELGGVRAGAAVLDVATGLGEPALSAAAAVAPGGHVLGIDLSPAMIDAARHRAAGRSGIEYAVLDMEDDTLEPGSFDVVLSRWGLMFAVDHAGLFTSIERVLRPGGVLAAAVWAAPPAAPVMALGFGVLSEQLGLTPPPPGTPGPFSMADPGRLCADLSAAGFTEVTVESQVVPFRFASADEFAGFSRSVSPPVLLDAVTRRYGSPDAPQAWDAVAAAAAARFTDGGGVVLPSTALCVRAVRPAR